MTPLERVAALYGVAWSENDYRAARKRAAEEEDAKVSHVKEFLADVRAGRIVGERAVAAMAERAILADAEHARARRRPVRASGPVGDGLDDDMKLMWPPGTFPEDDGRLSSVRAQRQAEVMASARGDDLDDDEFYEQRIAPLFREGQGDG